MSEHAYNIQFTGRLRKAENQNKSIKYLKIQIPKSLTLQPVRY